MPLPRDSAKPDRVMRPMEALDADFRMGPAGDQFGQREGWSFDKLREHTHGVMLNLPEPYDWWEKIAYPDRKFRLWHEIIAGEFGRLWATDAPTPALKLITRRDIPGGGVLSPWLGPSRRLENCKRRARSEHELAAGGRAWARRAGIRHYRHGRNRRPHRKATRRFAVSTPPRPRSWRPRAPELMAKAAGVRISSGRAGGCRGGPGRWRGPAWGIREVAAWATDGVRTSLRQIAVLGCPATVALPFSS
jgi:hypothetical protein